MCRLLGIAAAAPYEFGLLLREAPHSMAKLSHEHRDGWGDESWTPIEQGTLLRLDVGPAPHWTAIA